MLLACWLVPKKGFQYKADVEWLGWNEFILQGSHCERGRSTDLHLLLALLSLTCCSAICDYTSLDSTERQALSHTLDCTAPSRLWLTLLMQHEFDDFLTSDAIHSSRYIIALLMLPIAGPACGSPAQRQWGRIKPVPRREGSDEGRGC